MSQPVDDESCVSEDLVAGSRTLYLFFGGIAGGIGMPPFEFYRASRIIDDSRIFLRDPAQAWYQRGLPGIGDDCHAVGQFISSRISESGAPEVRFVGNSMGGFAALLFCSMLGVGSAIAFSPQTFVNTALRHRFRDTRWAEQIQRMHETRSAVDVEDLKPWVRRHHPTLRAEIYVSRANTLDIHHVQRLRRFPNIAVHHFDGAGHDLVRELRDAGRLAEILKPSPT